MFGLFRPLVREAIKIRNAFSKQLNSFRLTTKWRPEIKNLVDLVDFMRDHFEYKADPLRGAADNVKSVGVMCSQYLRSHKALITGDCDDMATFVGWGIRTLQRDAVPDPRGSWSDVEGVWRVNIPAHKHVICVWSMRTSAGVKYAYSSNRTFFTDNVFHSIDQIVNHYADRTGKRKDVQFFDELVAELRR